MSQQTPDPNAAYTEGWNRARELVDWLRTGGALPQQDSPFPLQPGEAYHCGITAETAHYVTPEVTYRERPTTKLPKLAPKKMKTVSGGLMGKSVDYVEWDQLPPEERVGGAAGRTLHDNSGHRSVTRSAFNVAKWGVTKGLNARDKRKAEEAAVPDWEPVGTTTVHVTDQRLAYQAGEQSWGVALAGGISAFEPQWQGYALAVVPADGGAPVSFTGPAVPYLGVVLWHLLHQGVPDLDGGSTPVQ